MSTLTSIGIFAGGVVLLVVGGDLLVRGAVAIAERLGVKPLYVGLTLVAFGTSAPELALNLVAAADNNTGLTFGNMVGSSLANAGWILGLLAMVQPVKVESSLLRRELPLLLGGVLLVVALCFLPPHTPNGTPGLNRWDGALMLMAFGWTLWVMLSSAKGTQPTEAELQRELVERATAEPIPSVYTSVIQILGGLVLLGIGGKLGETGAVGLAQALGFSQQLIGLTVVSFATTLPELVTSMLAARKGQSDLALGNIVGSNLFNLLFILGTVAMITHVPLPAGAGTSLAGLVCITLVLFPVALTFNWTITRLEGLLLALLYVVFIGYQVLQAVLW
jgi:cation:H+ antiporter